MTETTQFFSNLGENITLLLVLALAHGRLIAYLPITRPWLRGSADGLLFAAIAILGMLLPLNLSQGVVFDSRPIIVMAAAIFGGTLSGAVAAACVGLWSLHLGGPGAILSCGEVATAALIGIAMQSRRRAVDGWPRRLVPGVLVAVSSLAWTFVLPWDIARLVVREMALPLLIYYPLAFALVTAVVSYEQHQRARER
ncbi:MAG: hypothetical protein JO255_21950, partial [Alphaproteobacteria bacterium]|nr:hypothetical protein [Alphaproteobacteria bacterium]